MIFTNQMEGRFSLLKDVGVKDADRLYKVSEWIYDFHQTINWILGIIGAIIVLILLGIGIKEQTLGPCILGLTALVFFSLVCLLIYMIGVLSTHTAKVLANISLSLLEKSILQDKVPGLTLKEGPSNFQKSIGSPLNTPDSGDVRRTALPPATPKTDEQKQLEEEADKKLEEGFKLLRSGRPKEALAIYIATAEAYPDSRDAWRFIANAANANEKQKIRARAEMERINQLH